MCCSFLAWLRYGADAAHCLDAWLMNLLLNDEQVQRAAEKANADIEWDEPEEEEVMDGTEMPDGELI